MRVLYSFPNRIGGARICSTAWQQVVGASSAGAQVTVLTPSVARRLPSNVEVIQTLAIGPARMPLRWIGRQLIGWIHDALSAEWLRRNADRIEIVHGWPLASARTLRTALELGIPTVLERPNAHTAFAFEAAEQESEAVGMSLPEGHDHYFDGAVLRREEEEYVLADYLLCPSDFVAETFLARRFSASRLLRHHYGYDHKRFVPGEQNNANEGLRAIYAGSCEPRKGLHLALRSWFESGAHERGRLKICGGFVPGYAEKLGPLLSHPSVEVLGHRHDLPELMRSSDVFILSSIEEGSALVTYEARGSGCVLLVSKASGAMVRDGAEGLVHETRDVAGLAAHIRKVDCDRSLLARLRENSLQSLNEITWQAAGERLLACYRSALQGETAMVAHPQPAISR